MALYINTNMASLTATRQLGKTTSVLNTTFQRLSTGFRINSAKDDTAGLAISTKMTAQIKGTNQAVRNANDAVSLMQVAEGALIESENALQRMRELAVQAGNATNTGSDRDDIQKEMTALVAEIDRIATTTEYNNQRLLSGGFKAKDFQVGADAGQTIQFSIASATVSALIGGVAINGISVGSGAAAALGGATAASKALGYIDTAIASVSDMRADLGAYQNRMESLMANLTSLSENTSASRSRIMDADIAAETANLTKNAIMQQAGTAILAQANQQPQIALQLLG